ncbi:acyl-CoA synthetase [Acidobacteria bacterium AH-259-D05]|nr:acyl-CoA synthetase [Acidobacteria bacterium AH-259-D05]
MADASSLPLLDRAAAHDDRIAIIDKQGKHTYRHLLTSANQVASFLLSGSADLEEAPVAFMVPPGLEYAAVQWGIWKAGGVAVPLCVSHPPSELEHVLGDSTARIVVSHPDFEKTLAPIARTHKVRLLLTSETPKAKEWSHPKLDMDRRAMILYTSGTTNKPTGVVSTHGNIAAQITTLVEAWKWTADDHILHVLPLHHTHGIINVLLCALWAGATCEILPGFDSIEVWDRFISSDLTLFMAVPTIYVKLISAWESAGEQKQRQMSRACSEMRLMVSGSAALPVNVFKKWHQISGHLLLERYGMTEIGMALSNPLKGERRAGSVGLPLPGVEVRLRDKSDQLITEEGKAGEIQVRGPGVFQEYLGQPEATARAFRDGWFCTGDEAVIEKGYFRILGRSFIDVIKTGGYKVSALEIEELLRTHPVIKECAVVGVADEEWGERVCAAVIPDSEGSLSLDDLRSWAKERMAHYKVPTELLLVNELPRNVMGKVIKPKVRGLFQSRRYPYSTGSA